MKLLFCVKNKPKSPPTVLSKVIFKDTNNSYTLPGENIFDTVLREPRNQLKQTSLGSLTGILANIRTRLSCWLHVARENVNSFKELPSKNCHLQTDDILHKCSRNNVPAEKRKLFSALSFRSHIDLTPIPPLPPRLRVTQVLTPSRSKENISNQ